MLATKKGDFHLKAGCFPNGRVQVNDTYLISGIYYVIRYSTYRQRLEVFKIGRGGVDISNVFQERGLKFTQHTHVYKLHLCKFLK